MEKKLLSQRHPIFYFISIWEKRIRRYFKWYINSKKYATICTADKLPFRIKKHQSVLIRKLCGSEMYLQYNKVTNLKIAIKEINGIIIKKIKFAKMAEFCKSGHTGDFALL